MISSLCPQIKEGFSFLTGQTRLWLGWFHPWGKAGCFRTKRTEMGLYPNGHLLNSVSRRTKHLTKLSKSMTSWSSANRATMTWWSWQGILKPAVKWTCRPIAKCSIAPWGSVHGLWTRQRTVTIALVPRLLCCETVFILQSQCLLPLLLFPHCSPPPCLSPFLFFFVAF